jgi:excisionase family DNA binding protein
MVGPDNQPLAEVSAAAAVITWPSSYGALTDQAAPQQQAAEVDHPVPDLPEVEAATGLHLATGLGRTQALPPSGQEAPSDPALPVPSGQEALTRWSDRSASDGSMDGLLTCKNMIFWLFGPVAQDRTDSRYMKRASPRNSATPMELTPVHTADDVAAILQVASRTVRRLTYEGLMPCRRIGRLVRYTDADVQAYLDQCADRGVA